MFGAPALFYKSVTHEATLASRLLLVVHRGDVVPRLLGPWVRTEQEQAEKAGAGCVWCIVTGFQVLKALGKASFEYALHGRHYVQPPNLQVVHLDGSIKHLRQPLCTAHNNYDCSDLLDIRHGTSVCAGSDHSMRDGYHKGLRAAAGKLEDNMPYQPCSEVRTERVWH